MRLRIYQELFVEHARSVLLAGGSRLYTSPTGTGKSVMEIALQDRLLAEGANPWLITPRLEIIEGILEKRGLETKELSEARLVDLAIQYRTSTPIRFRNALLAGEILPPSHLIIDEGHHTLATTYQEILCLCGGCPAVLVTATGYRGTPAGTADLRRQWGEPIEVLSLPEAVENGWLSFPTVRLEPLLDDDQVEISNGEFVVSQLEHAVADTFDRVVELCPAWDRPTMFALPGRESARLLHERFGGRTVYVDGDTSREDRRDAFRACVACEKGLVQIGVVSEGVDLPIRRLIDLAPAMSPVKWMQQLGRITRPVGPGEAPPEYVCTNRNLLRHAYLLHGVLPPAIVREHQQAFGLGKRAGVRVVGLEGLGRFAGAELPLADGSTGLMYCVSAVEGANVTEYACLVSPGDPEPIWATKRNVRHEEGTAYGRWIACEAPEGLQGFSSVPPKQMSDKQKAWWKRSASRHGLDGDAVPTRKSFAALPVLSDLRLSIGGVS